MAILSMHNLSVVLAADLVYQNLFSSFFLDSAITCVSSSSTISLSRCQLFEAGFHPGALHLRDDSCKGTLQDGRLVFHFNNDDLLCGTVLRVRAMNYNVISSECRIFEI